MSAPITTGYDAAQAQRGEDDLDRWRFAADIVEVVLATPPEWSARLGVFGKWGEGKSTILRFAEQMLNDKKCIVFTFNPWAVQNWNDLWEDFGSRLSEALSDAGMKCESSWRQAAKSSSDWLQATGVADIAQGALAFAKADKLYDAAFRLVRRWLQYDGEQIKLIREKLQGQRLVVLVDDLDRCNPQLIPQLLLSLRELLDLPGFTFILAFDDEIVAKALATENPSWVDGSSFLEKILDFRFHLPPVSEPQKARLIERAILKYCPFVLKESAKNVQDLLPNNPRKLKALIRSLVAFQPEVARHDCHELNWTDMWLAQMIRLESYAFFERLLAGDTLDKEAGIHFQFRIAREKKGEHRNESLRQTIKEAGVNSPATTERLVQLMEAVRSRSSPSFRYVCELATRPPAVTWKEFHSFYSKWKADRKPSVVSNWIQQHAKERDSSTDDVEHELFEAMIVKRNEYLSSAAESASLDEHDSFVQEAEDLLMLIKQDLLDLRKLDKPRFSKLCGQAKYWIGFRKNPTDGRLRDTEQAVLVDLSASASQLLSTELFEVILPQDWDIGFGEGRAEKRALRSKCLELIAPKAAKEALEFLTRDGAVRSLSEVRRFPAVKYCLFDAKSPVWTTSLSSQLLQLIQEGQQDSTIFANVRELFILLVHGVERGIDSIQREDIAGLLKHQKFVRELWNTVISRRIQYRMQMSFIEGRQRLIENGVPETILPLTEELQFRLTEEQGQSGAARTETTENPAIERTEPH